MDIRKGKVTCEQARGIDIVDYLAGLGFEPAKIRGNDFWYHSPLRQERTPSFKVNRRINRWYDFGEGCGGSLIDFAIRFNGCTISEFLMSLSDHEWRVDRVGETATGSTTVRNPVEMLHDCALRSPTLLEYLKERRIPIAVADRFCREIHYRVNGRDYFAIGFPNDAGGWEYRNTFFKGCISPKETTTVRNGGQVTCVFEGFMDFLSFMAMQPKEATGIPFDGLVLNSLALFEKARPTLESYLEIHLYLDNDPSGQQASRYACSLDARYRDKSDLYKNHKDVNDLLCHFGKGRGKRRDVFLRPRN